jgi:hypothetical protein
MTDLRCFGLACLVAVALGGLPASGQAVISARSGVIHYVEGQVYLGDKAIEPKFGTFPDMKEKNELRTADGRAEVLLTPGVFLRVAENSSIRMITNRLIDTRLELLRGSIMVEVVELLKDNAVTLVYKDASVSPNKRGLYRLDTDPAQLRVYDGEALVESASQRITLKDGKMLSLTGVWAAAKFDNKSGDSLYRWSRRRAGYLAMANVSGAKLLNDSGRSLTSSGWLWNPYLAMFTYMPYRGVYNSPFGFQFYSPQQVYRIYAPQRRLAYSGFNAGAGHRDQGYSTVPRTAARTSGAIAAAPSQPASSPAPRAESGVARDSGRAGGRSR